MASRIIETYEIGTEITRLIKGSNRRVRLVSPYLRLWKHLEDAITDAAQRKVDVKLLYRREERDNYAQTVANFVKAGVKVYDWERLHAKLYLGDSACIITSMNLDGSSAANSEEFAMLSDEPAVVEGITKYIERLFGSTQALAISAKPTASAVKQAVARIATPARPTQGVCIRCDQKVPLNPAKPLCPNCFKSWVQYEDEDYPEKFCHTCAKPSRTSVRRPVCKTCYDKGY